MRLGINQMAQDRYRDYKYKVYQHFKLKGADEPYKQMSEEVWENCVECNKWILGNSTQELSC